jgi:hypothetical protein
VLALAAVSGRIVVSHDSNTLIRHFKEFCDHHESPGLIMIRQNANHKLAIESIIMIWTASSAEEWHNAVVHAPF